MARQNERLTTTTEPASVIRCWYPARIDQSCVCVCVCMAIAVSRTKRASGNDR